MAFANETQRAYASASFFQRVAELRADLSERVAKYRLYRATMNELGMLTERELNDLGLCRGDIRTVARQAADQA